MDEEIRETGHDKRAHKRYHYTGKAFLTPPAEKEEEGTIVDLSLGGCLIRLNNPIEFFVDTEVEVNLQSSYLSFRAVGNVRRWGEKGCLVGLSFEKLTKHGTSDLLALIADLESGAVVMPTGDENADDTIAV